MSPSDSKTGDGGPVRTRGLKVMTILQLDPAKYGSREEYTVFLSQALRERGWESILVFASSPAASVQPHLEAAGAAIETFKSGSRLAQYADIFRLLRKYRPQVVQFHFFNHFTILPILAWLARPKVLIFTDQLRQPNRLSLLTRLECLFWDRVVLRMTGTQIVAVSDFVKRTLVTCYGMLPERIHVIHNGVNPERFSPLTPDEVSRVRGELGMPLHGPVVVCASHLRPGKGIEDLLAAAKVVLASRPDAFFAILGDGPLAETLRAQAKELGIENSARFYGRRSDVNRFMAAADVIAFPSTWHEPAGFVSLEGMAAGRPVVATRVGGIPEYLGEGGAGVLVEPHAPEQLACALLRLINSPRDAEAMGSLGRERVNGALSLEKCVEATLKLMLGLRGSGGP